MRARLRASQLDLDVGRQHASCSLIHPDFVNPTGMLAREAEAGFRRIGAVGAAALMGEVAAAFPGGPPSLDREERLGRLEALEDDARDELFAGLDDRFHALLGSELYPRAAAYVREHPREFIRDQ